MKINIDSKVTVISVIASVVLHLVIIAILLLAEYSSEDVVKPKTHPIETIDAVAFDDAEVTAEIERQRDIEKAKIQAEQDKVNKLKQEAKKAKLQREKEQKRLKELDKKRAKADKQRKEKQKRDAAKRKEEQRKKAQQQKKREAAEKKRLENIKAEQKKESARLEKIKVEREKEKKRIEQQKKAAKERERKEQERLKKIEEKRKAEEEKVKKAEEARKQAQREREIRDAAEKEAAAERAREEKLEQQARRRRAVRALNDYIPLIRNKVSKNWNQQPSFKGLKCTVSIRLDESGVVNRVSVVNSSGNSVFDRSVENAILRASPLPLPNEFDLKEFFKEIEFTFNPEK